jgi:Glycosyltransferase family 87
MARRRVGTAPLAGVVRTRVELLVLQTGALLHDRHRGRVYSIAAIAIFGVVFGGAIIAAALGSNPQFGIDFGAYWLAAGNMASGHSPYTPAMLAGPVPAQGLDAYKYAPLFAQMLVPLSWLPLWAAKLVWLAVQIATLVAALWIAARAGGTRDRGDRAISIGLAFTLFTPTFACLLQGNVEGPTALLLTVALAEGEGAVGAAMALAALLKLVPGLALPALVARGRRGVVVFAGVCTAFLVPSILLAPGAWRDFAVVFPNMIAGSGAYRNNLAPAGALAADPSLAPLAGLILPLRLAFVGAALVLLALSIWLARRRGGWPAALLAATLSAMLLPQAIWYHYTVLLLPFAFYAWSRASERDRLGMLAGLAGCALSVGWPLIFSMPTFLVFAGFGLHALWPSPVEAIDVVAAGRVGSMVAPDSGPAWASDAFGYPQADRGASSQVGAAEVALEGGVQVK